MAYFLWRMYNASGRWKKAKDQKEQEGCQERTEGCAVQDCAQTAGEEGEEWKKN